MSGEVPFDRLALVAPPRPPDLLVRLEAEIPVTASAAFLAGWWAQKQGTAREVSECIQYLRAANQRHCDDDKTIKAQGDRIVALQDEGAAYRRRIADLEAALAAAHAQEGR
jgi:hypothetical protein